MDLQTGTVPHDRDVIIVCDDLHNLGDAALVLQNIETLRRDRPGARILVRRWSEPPRAMAEQITAAGGTIVSGRDMLDFTRRCRGADIVIGGGQMVRENGSWRGLVLLLAGVCVARATGGEVIARAIGADAIASRRRRWLWAAILERCRIVSVRDRISAANVRALAPRATIVSAADMMFTPTALTARLGTPAAGDAPRVAVIAPCVDDSEGRSARLASFAELGAAIAAELPRTRIVVACHDVRDGMDIRAADAAAEALAVAPLVFRESSVGALVDLYRAADLVVTNRLHGVIFALLADCPVLVIDDGTSKLRDIVALFALDTLAVDRAYAADELRRLICAARGFDRAARREIRSNLAMLSGDGLARERRVRASTARRALRGTLSRDTAAERRRRR